MLSQYSTILFSIFAALGAHASALPRSNTCHSVDSGYFSTFIQTTPGNGGDKALDLSSKKELTFGNGSPIQAEFQACPELTNPSYKYAGRVVLKPTSSNLCLTVTNPSAPATGPYYVKAEKCTSNTKPSAAQTWGFGDDFGNVIFYVGSPPCSDGAGVNIDSNGQPILGPNKQIQLTCSASSYESMTLTKKK